MTTESKTAGGRYSVAQSAHYELKDLQRALELYREITIEHAETREADQSREQIEIIVRAVVPREVLFETQLSCALEQFGNAGSSRRGSARLTPISPLESN